MYLPVFLQLVMCRTAGRVDSRCIESKKVHKQKQKSLSLVSYLSKNALYSTASQDITRIRKIDALTTYKLDKSTQFCEGDSCVYKTYMKLQGTEKQGREWYSSRKSNVTLDGHWGRLYRYETLSTQRFCTETNFINIAHAVTSRGIPGEQKRRSAQRERGCLFQQINFRRVWTGNWQFLFISRWCSHANTPSSELMMLPKIEKAVKVLHICCVHKVHRTKHWAP